MPSAGTMNIRKFEKADREKVRNIFFETTLLGEPASLFFEGKEILSDALTLYFTDYEPESCFVAETESGVVGCLVGAKDREVLEKVLADKVYPRILKNAFIQGVLFRVKNLRFFWELLVSVLKGEFKLPVDLSEYPAILHINIENGYRGSDIGTKLMQAYLNYLRDAGVRGVSLATMSDKAAHFFEKQGFSLFHAGKRSYFKYLLHRDLPLYIYVKKL